MVLSNYEKFSSTVKDFQVLYSVQSPTLISDEGDDGHDAAAEGAEVGGAEGGKGAGGAEKGGGTGGGAGWQELGTFQARERAGEQRFEVEPPRYARYLKVRLLSHWGNEFYCTLSQIKVRTLT